MFDFDRVCKLHKRILKHDATAIDEIETLEEAKEIIKMMASQMHQMVLEEIIKKINIEKNSDKYKHYDDYFRCGVDSGLEDAEDIITEYLNN